MEPIFKIWQAWMQSSPGQQSNLRDRGAAALMQHLLLDADNYSRQQKRVWVIHVIYWNAWIWGGSLLFGRYFSKFSKFISGPRIFQKLLWVHRPLKPNPLVPPWPVHHRLSRNADLDGPISDLNRLSDYCLSQLRIRRHFRYHGNSKNRHCIHFILARIFYETPLKDCGRPAPSKEGFHIIKFKQKMDATPSFGVTMISSRRLDLARLCPDRLKTIHRLTLEPFIYCAQKVCENFQQLNFAFQYNIQCCYESL